MLNTLAIKAVLALALVSGLGLMGAGLARAFYKPRLEAARLELAVAEAEVSRLAAENQGLQELRKLDQATLASVSRARAAIARESASLRLKLAAALDANRAWADQPVPKEVQDALEQP